MNWHIGQRIVALRDSESGFYKKDDTYTLISIRQSPCKCGGVDLDIGRRANGDKWLSECDVCGYSEVERDVLWFFQGDFAPLDDLSNHTADSLMEEMDKTIKQLV